MSDERTTEGGTDWELTQAENAISAAGTDMDALARAQRRHADAIRNMMQGALVPSFVQLVERVLGAKIDPLSDAIGGLRTDVQDSAREVAARLGKIEGRLADDEQRLDSKRQRIEALEADVAALRMRIDDEFARRLAALEARADG